MDKILLINKESGYTSRDVVNIVSGIFHTKKVGHFGTLDPLAEGLLVVGIGHFTKLSSLDLFNTKEYICDCLVGQSTTTYDLEGDITSKKDITLSKETILKGLNHFKKTYLQEVPIYSSVKVNGKKLYDYARNNLKVTLPKKEVTIYDIELLDIYTKDEKQYFKFRTIVSKGTYIRSLVNDISQYLDVPLTMAHLFRTKQGLFSIEDSYRLKDIEKGLYKFCDIEKYLDISLKEINKENKKQILNGVKQEKNDDSKNLILYKENSKNIAIYKLENNYYKVLFFFQD